MWLVVWLVWLQVRGFRLLRLSLPYRKLKYAVLELEKRIFERVARGCSTPALLLYV